MGSTRTCVPDCESTPLIHDSDEPLLEIHADGWFGVAECTWLLVMVISLRESTQERRFADA